MRAICAYKQPSTFENTSSCGLGAWHPYVPVYPHDCNGALMARCDDGTGCHTGRLYLPYCKPHWSTRSPEWIHQRLRHLSNPHLHGVLFLHGLAQGIYVAAVYYARTPAKWQSTVLL